jgi:hypothetical protein
MAKKKKTLKKKTPAVDDRELKEWAKRGVVLKDAKNGNQWAIADWLLAGEKEIREKKFTKKDAYDAAEKATGMKRSSLYQFKYTAQCFPTISTRVKKLSFGHHRLVAKKKKTSEDGVESGYTKQERKQYLRVARTRKLCVARFANYLKSKANKAERHQNTPTNADAVAEKVENWCQGLLDRLRFLTDEPPKNDEVRKNVLVELRATADRLNKKAEWLNASWEQFDNIHYKDLVAAEAAASAVSGA